MIQASVCQKPFSGYVEMIADWRTELFRKPPESLIRLFPFGELEVPPVATSTDSANVVEQDGEGAMIEVRGTQAGRARGSDAGSGGKTEAGSGKSGTGAEARGGMGRRLTAGGEFVTEASEAVRRRLHADRGELSSPSTSAR